MDATTTRPQHEAIIEHSGRDSSDFGHPVSRYFDDPWDDAATVDDLAGYVHGRDSTERDEVRIGISLHHVPLSKLDAGGLVDSEWRSSEARSRWDSLARTAE